MDGGFKTAVMHVFPHSTDQERQKYATWSCGEGDLMAACRQEGAYHIAAHRQQPLRLTVPQLHLSFCSAGTLKKEVWKENSTYAAASVCPGTGPRSKRGRLAIKQSRSPHLLDRANKWFSSHGK